MCVCVCVCVCRVLDAFPARVVFPTYERRKHVRSRICKVYSSITVDFYLGSTRFVSADDDSRLILCYIMYFISDDITATINSVFSILFIFCIFSPPFRLLQLTPIYIQ